MPDPLTRIADALERIAAVMERQEPPNIVLKAVPPITDEQAAVIRRKLQEQLRKEGRAGRVG